MFSDSAVFFSGLVTRLSLVSPTLLPVYSFTSTGACLQPESEARSESEARVIAEIPMTHPLNSTPTSEQSQTLQLLLVRKRHQNKN